MSAMLRWNGFFSPRVVRTKQIIAIDKKIEIASLYVPLEKTLKKRKIGIRPLGVQRLAVRRVQPASSAATAGGQGRRVPRRHPPRLLRHDRHGPSQLLPGWLSQRYWFDWPLIVPWKLVSFCSNRPTTRTVLESKRCISRHPILFTFRYQRAKRSNWNCRRCVLKRRSVPTVPGRHIHRCWPCSPKAARYPQFTPLHLIIHAPQPLVLVEPEGSTSSTQLFFKCKKKRPPHKKTKVIKLFIKVKCALIFFFIKGQGVLKGVQDLSKGSVDHKS